MAEAFTVVQSYPDVEFLGGTATRNVQVTGAVTADHGIYFEVRVPAKVFAELGKAPVYGPAVQYAEILEALANEPNVAGVQWGQQTYGGSLQDIAIITVASSSGDSTSELTLPFASIGPKLAAPQIQALHKQLNENEGQ